MKYEKTTERFENESESRQLAQGLFFSVLSFVLNLAELEPSHLLWAMISRLQVCVPQHGTWVAWEL